MKGFGGIILLFAVLITATILLAANMQTTQEYSFKELIPQTKAKISSYELTLKQSTTDCDWLNGATIKSCIEAKATALNNATDYTGGITCTQESVIPSGADFNITMNCHANSTIMSNTIEIDASKVITLKKP